MSKKQVLLEVFDNHDKITFYTLRIKGETYSEAEKFFSNHKNDKKYLEGIFIILRKMERMGKTGCDERHFRYEGKAKDRVCALPEHLTATKLRLYAIRISENIVILGNGGLKTTKTYNEDKHLNTCVEFLQVIDGIIKKRILNKEIISTSKVLSGNLKFEL